MFVNFKILLKHLLWKALSLSPSRLLNFPASRHYTSKLTGHCAYTITALSLYCIGFDAQIALILAKADRAFPMRPWILIDIKISAVELSSQLISFTSLGWITWLSPLMKIELCSHRVQPIRSMRTESASFNAILRVRNLYTHKKTAAPRKSQFEFNVLLGEKHLGSEVLW